MEKEEKEGMATTVGYHCFYRVREQWIEKGVHSFVPSTMTGASALQEQMNKANSGQDQVSQVTVTALIP